MATEEETRRVNRGAAGVAIAVATVDVIALLQYRIQITGKHNYSITD